MRKLLYVFVIVALAFVSFQSVAAAPKKYIIINLSTNRLYALENGVIVFKTSVATGKKDWETPVGLFRVQRKLPIRDMQGSANGETWLVKNVPNVLYFSGGIAIHGTYWHNQFGPGVRRSHGCVNISVAASEWLYPWADIGTRVEVREK